MAHISGFKTYLFKEWLVYVIFPLITSPLKEFHTNIPSSLVSPVVYIQLVINFSRLYLLNVFDL